jgi:flagellar biosynthesis chaperone FliJ
MGYLSTSTYNRLVTQLTRIEAQIELANETIDSLLTKEIESYSLDTGEGKQSAKRWDAMKLDQLISTLEQRAEHIRQRLAGLGVVAMNVRRKDDL